MNEKLYKMSQEFFRNINTLSSYKERMKCADEYYKKWYLVANNNSRGEKFAIGLVPEYVLKFFPGAKNRSIYLFSPSVEELKMFAQNFRQVYFSSVPAIETKLPANVIQYEYNDQYEIENNKKEFVDYIFSHHVIEHIHSNDIEKHFRLAFKYIKPGGEYVVICPSDIRIFKDETSKNLDEKIAANHHIGRYSYNDISKIAMNVGFRRSSCPLINPQLINIWLDYKNRFSEIILKKIYKIVPNQIFSFLGYNSLYIRLKKINKVQN